MSSIFSSNSKITNKILFYFLKERTQTFCTSFNFFFIFVTLFEKKYIKFLFFVLSLSKIRSWIRISIRFQNPGSGSAWNGCGSETLFTSNRCDTPSVTIFELRGRPWTVVFTIFTLIHLSSQHSFSCNSNNLIQLSGQRATVVIIVSDPYWSQYGSGSSILGQYGSRYFHDQNERKFFCPPKNIFVSVTYSNIYIDWGLPSSS